MKSNWKVTISSGSHEKDFTKIQFLSEKQPTHSGKTNFSEKGKKANGKCGTKLHSDKNFNQETWPKMFQFWVPSEQLD